MRPGAHFESPGLTARHLGWKKGFLGEKTQFLAAVRAQTLYSGCQERGVTWHGDGALGLRGTDRMRDDRHSGATKRGSKGTLASAAKTCQVCFPGDCRLSAVDLCTCSMKKMFTTGCDNLHLGLSFPI